MNAPNRAGSSGGAIDGLPPVAQAGERAITTSTFTPRCFAAATFSPNQFTWSWLIAPGCGSPLSHVPQSRTQSAPRSAAVGPTGSVWLIVSLTPVSTAEAGAVATANAAASVRRRAARWERMAPLVIGTRGGQLQRRRTFSTRTETLVAFCARSRTLNVSVCSPRFQSALPHQGSIEPPDAAPGAHVLPVGVEADPSDPAPAAVVERAYAHTQLAGVAAAVDRREHADGRRRAVDAAAAAAARANAAVELAERLRGGLGLPAAAIEPEAACVERSRGCPAARTRARRRRTGRPRGSGTRRGGAAPGAVWRRRSASCRPSHPRCKRPRCVFQPISVIQIGLAASPWSAMTAYTSRYAENV